MREIFDDASRHIQFPGHERSRGQAHRMNIAVRVQVEKQTIQKPHIIPDGNGDIHQDIRCLSAFFKG